jgi:hypothetical protein
MAAVWVQAIRTASFSLDLILWESGKTLTNLPFPALAQRQASV